MKKKYSPDVERLLKQLVEDCDSEDVEVRQRQIRTWRRLKLFWENFTQIWYSEVAHDWRVWDEQERDEDDQSYYDKPVNIFRAYLESIIAALSVTVPPIKCYPDDADSTLDLLTAKAGDKIAQLIFRHNDAPLLWIHALFIYGTEGMVAAYAYPKSDKSYGTYEKKSYEDETTEEQYAICTKCGFQMDDRILGEASTLRSQQEDRFMPGEENVEFDAATMEGEELCPSCMQFMIPEIKRESFTVTRLVGVTNEPKSRVCIENYGGLNVKISNFAKKQTDCAYLQFSTEQDYSLVMEEYKDLRGDKDLLKSVSRSGGASGGAYDQYEEWGRLSPQYRATFPDNVVTVKHTWLRPGKFNSLKEDDADELRKLFPDGVKVTLVNQCFACACPEALDDCWTLTYNPLADFVHFDPIGMLLTSIQEITNDLISLTLQTIEHGIGQTFADPEVLNFKQYRDTSVTPGGIFPAKARSGKNLGEGFHELKTANLSPEVMPFGNQIQQLAQLTSAAQPSLFGGQLEGSGTASEYSMSRAQALQRLQTTWKMLTHWWKNVFGKAIPIFIKEMQDDERDVQRNADGSFLNVFIRRAELEGKIGKVELEANENLPMTWAQRKDTIMQLLQGGNPEILAIIGTPENLPLLREAIGLTDLTIPDEEEIEGTYDDIKLLLNSEPMVQPPDPMMEQQAMMAGMPPPPPIEQPSIQPDPEIDTLELRFRVVRNWIQSEAGRQAKTDMPGGYKNVLLYAKACKMLMMPPPGMMPPGPGGDGAAPPEKTPEPKLKPAPIMGEGDVQTVQ